MKPNTAEIGAGAAAEQAGFIAIMTVDASLHTQQNMARRTIAVILLRSPRNDIETLGPMAEMVEASLTEIQPGQVVVLTSRAWRRKPS
jgi:hypothetical protein